MERARIIQFPRVQKDHGQIKIKSRRDKSKGGRVYARGNKLWVDFYYLGQGEGAIES